MRARIGLLFAFVALTVGVVGCGSNGAASKTQQPTSTPTAMSSGQLQARLLTAGDLGSGWRRGEAINPADLAAFAQLPCEGATVSPGIANRLTAVTGAQFEPADRSYKHLIELVVTGERSQLDRDLQSLFGAMESCPARSPASARGAKVTVKKFTIPSLGDQRAAYAITQSASTGKTVLYVRTSYVRLGPVAVALGLADFQATAQGESKITDETYVQLLRTAVGKLSA